MTIKDAILKVLEEQKSALTYMEVHDKINEHNYVDWSNAKTPSDTIAAQLGHFIRKNDTRVKRVKGKKGFEYYLSKYENELNLFEIIEKETEHIIHGNEKVIRPRLADAEFFYNKDKAFTLKKFSENLSSIIYHNKLGTQHDRALRVAKILSYLSKKLGFTSKVDFKDLALHSKADLLSLMVGEFPDLQGNLRRRSTDRWARGGTAAAEGSVLADHIGL